MTEDDDWDDEDEGVPRMTNAELIAILQKLPPEKEVSLFWDGGARGSVEGIVNADDEIVIVGEWSIYRGSKTGDPNYEKYRAFPESQIVYG